MGWSISIVDEKGEVVSAPETHQLKGGTYALGGQKELELSETFNYSSTLRNVFPWRTINNQVVYGIWTLDGMSTEDAKHLLVQAVNQIIEEGVTENVSLMPHDNYWEPTLGNALAMLLRMLELSRLGKGYWRIEG